MGHRSRRGVPSIDGDSQEPVCHVKSRREPVPTAEHHPNLPGGGRTWWAHVAFTRINITPTILRKQIEDVREARASTPNLKMNDRILLVSANRCKRCLRTRRSTSCTC